MDKSLPIPTLEDWDWGKIPCPHDKVKADYARSRYWGRSTTDLLSDCFNHAFPVMEDICYMPPIPFRYYMLAYAEWLMSPALVGDDFDLNHESASGASIFLNAVDRMLLEHPEFILPIMDKLMPVARHVAENQKLYDADLDIFGSFPDRLKENEANYEKLRKSAEADH